jgi:D(-)-tartrate dehydratase
MSVRIVDVREITKPISSPIRNAYIDFTKMTTSLVAVVTDAARDGKPVVGTASIPTAVTGRAD